MKDISSKRQLLTLEKLQFNTHIFLIQFPLRVMKVALPFFKLQENVFESCTVWLYGLESSRS